MQKAFFFLATSGGKREKARSCSLEFLLAVKHLKERLVQEGTRKEGKKRKRVVSLPF